MTAEEELEALSDAYWILVPIVELPEPIKRYRHRASKHIGVQRDALAARLLAEVCEDSHE